MKAAALCSFAAALMLAATVSACGKSSTAQGLPTAQGSPTAPGPPTVQGRPTPQATTPRIVTTTTPPHSPRVLPPTATTQPKPSPDVSPPPVPGQGTVVGRVLAGPTCPVATAEKSCPPRPVQALVAARDAVGRTIESTKTAPDGRFTMTLPKGMYSLVAITGKVLPRCSKVQVTVRSSRRTQTTIGCDTGIR